MSTDDSPEREFAYDREGLQRAPLKDAEGISNFSESEDMSNPMKKLKSRRTPRREVWWLDIGAENQNLESIKQHFEDCLDRFLLTSSDSLLRHLTSPMDSKLRHNLHHARISSWGNNPCIWCVEKCYHLSYISQPKWGLLNMWPACPIQVYWATYRWWRNAGN